MTWTKLIGLQKRKRKRIRGQITNNQTKWKKIPLPWNSMSFPQAKGQQTLFFGLVRARQQIASALWAKQSLSQPFNSTVLVQKQSQTKCKQMDVALFPKKVYLWTLKFEFHKMFTLRKISLLLLISPPPFFACGLYTTGRGLDLAHGLQLADPALSQHR